MQKTAIGWTEYSWNPFSGCEKVSPGCKYCYAETVAEYKRGTAAFPDGFEFTPRPHKLLEPFQLQEPHLIFLNSMSDLFLEDAPDALRDQILDVVEATPQHQYQVLTKRSERMLQYSRRRPLPSNVWAGVSVEEQDCAWRADDLHEVDASIRFLSLEPLLGPVSLDYSRIDWVIAGGESGPHLTEPDKADRALVQRVDGKWVPREDRVDWVRQIRDDCQEAGVPFFFKQWGGPQSSSAGNVLDGEKWEQFPEIPEAVPQSIKE